MRWSDNNIMTQGGEMRRQGDELRCQDEMTWRPVTMGPALLLPNIQQLMHDGAVRGRHVGIVLL